MSTIKHFFCYRNNNYNILNMKRIGLIITWILLFCSTMGYALEEDGSYKRVIWGIKGNLNAELPSKWKAAHESYQAYNSGFGVSAGGLANIYLGHYFYLEPEVALFYEGYSYNNIKAVAPNSPSVNAGPNINKIGIRLPVVVGYFFNISEKWGLNVFTGPQFSYAFYGKARSDNEEIKNDKDLMSVFNGQYAQRHFDASWKIGVGFPVEHFLISLEGDIGISDMLKNTYSFRENRVSLGITYYFVSR